MRFFDKELSREFRENPLHHSRAVIKVEGEIYDDTYYGGDNIRMDAQSSSVKFVKANEVRSTGDFSFLTQSLEAGEVLDSVNRAEVIPMSGVTIDGTIHWVKLGRFFVDSHSYVSTSDTTKSVKVSLVDSSDVFAQNRWRYPFTAGGGSYHAAVMAILQNRTPSGFVTEWLTGEDVAISGAPVVTYPETTSPWTAAFNLAIAGNADLYFDRNGWLIYEGSPPVNNIEPVYILGSDDYVTEFGGRTQSGSRKEIYNGVICRSNAPWLLFPVSGEYWDENPASPTWRNGKFGERPYMMSSPAVDQAQCEEIAYTEYGKRCGIVDRIAYNSLKDPLLLEGSALLLPNGRRYIVDLIQYPMGSQPMQVDLRWRI